MEGPPFRVLFLSQRNSARSMLAESIANTVGRGQFEAFSAGVRPATRVDPIAVELLEHAGLPVPDHPPQHVREFSAPDSPPLDFVFTLSDTAAGEAPPTWPGHPITAHWHCADPEQYDDDSERRLALIRARTELERRLRVFANLPVQSLDRMSLQAQVDALGESGARSNIAGMHARAGPRLSFVILCSGLVAGATAQAPADPEPLEEVVVNGEFPGPGMWKVTRPGHPERVLWIVGDPPPLPRRMKWKSRDVESVALRAQEILLDASVRMQPDEKIGVFRGLSLLPSALKARKNPDAGSLRERVPPELYARWLVQKKLYLGRDGAVEDWRPIFAADKLRRAAYDELRLRESGMVWEVVGKLAKKRKIPTTTPTLEFKFHTRDLKSKIKEFSRATLADTECFAVTLDLTEALSNRDTEARRAQAWATADLATLESLPPLPNPFVPCATAVLDSGLAREIIPADIREQLYGLWIEAAVKSLETQATTLAIVPLSKLTREGGYLERLRARGYEVEAPK